ncbi:MAG: hypothetical protein FJ354_06985 [Thaumarchaeota archaeon]|nr:hypothetical protein [Nitrososphaerota archaeon]
MQDRTGEWFVPKFGPRNFRRAVGILFLPYTGIVTCFAIWGSLVENFAPERTIAIAVIYFLALGVSAHLLDAVGGKTKPWGELPKRKIAALAITILGLAFAIGIYYSILDSPLLIPIGIAEGFFLFAYNLELFKGRFHNNFWTVISWGILPVFAGSAIQTNSISIQTVILGAIAGALTLALIRTSKKYKGALYGNADQKIIKKQATILKIISLGVIGFTGIFFIVLELQ